MERWVAVLIMGAAGGIVAIQPALNAGLGRATGVLAAAMISFAIGALALATLVLASGQAGDVGGLDNVRWYYLLGGLCGALWVAFSIVAVDSIGAGGVVSATITGQLTASVVADRLGILGLDQVALTPARILGVALLLAGTALVVR